MRNSILFCCLFFVELASAQINFNQYFKSVDSLLQLRQQGSAALVLDALRSRAVYDKDWNRAIHISNKRARLFKNYIEGITYLDSDTMQLILDHLPKDDLMIAKIDVLEGYFYDKLGKPEKALAYYEKALTLYELTKASGGTISYTYHTAGQNAMIFIDYEKAESYFLRSLETDTLQKKYHMSAYAHLCMASNFQRKFSKALQYYELGSRLSGRLKDKFLLNNEGAITYANLKQVTKSKALLNTSFQLLQQASTKFKTNKIDDYYQASGRVYDLLGEPDLVRKLFQSGVDEAIKANAGKKGRNVAKLYVRLGDWYFNNKDYSKALDAFHAGMIQVFPDFNDPNVLSNPPSESVESESFMMTSAKRKIKTYLQLYKADNNPDWLKAAEPCIDIVFLSAENLRSTFNDDDAKFYLEHFNANILEAAIHSCFLLLETENDPSYAQKAYQLAEQHKSLVLREAIFENKGLIISGALKQRDYVDVKTIQSNLLNNHTTLLQFQWGEEFVFIFQISKNDFKLTQIPRDQLDPKLDAFFKIISDRTAQENNPSAFFQSANQLYQSLLKESLADLTEINQLIIIPDGPLTSIPFEALLFEPFAGSFAQAPYLINQYQFQYAYSPSLILQESIEKNKLEGILAVAPIFKNQQRDLSTLSQSESEIRGIETPGLNLLVGERATLVAFIKGLENKQILHLSTHAKANTDELPPRIEFADTSLYLPRLYSMNIPAELVVLSTCESNLGAYAKGEGVMSLSRGFAYAGAESMIASLWAVNENSSAQLFTNYYQQLKTKSKAKALHFAKFNYLNDLEIRDRHKAPYYWAGFVFTGKDGVIEMGMPFFKNPMFYLLGIVGLGLLFFLRKRFRV